MVQRIDVGHEYMRLQVIADACKTTYNLLASNCSSNPLQARQINLEVFIFNLQIEELKFA